MRPKLLLTLLVTINAFFSTVGQGSSSFFLGEPTSEYLKSADAENPRPPVLLLPGLVSSRLVAWKRKVCRGPDINIQDVVWLNLQKLVETMTYDHHCWIDCMKLGKNGTDPPDCKIRADEGLSAIGELSPGNIYTPPATSIFTALIKMLAHELGYDRNSIIGAPYDWRLAPIQLQQRDSYFKTLKQWLEVAVERHQRPAIVIAHSMGTNIFMYFCDWLRVHDKPAMGYEKWMRKHVWTYIGIAAPLLGSPGALKSVMSGHQFGLTITEMQARELQLTFASTHFLNPRSSQNLANRVYKNMMKNKTLDYTDPLVIIKSASGSSQVNFGINDVENGEIFRWVGNMYKEPLMLDKYEALQELYLKDPLKPLQGSYKRPPVRHVMMIYGVDLPTEIAYTYRISDNNNPGPPILDEIFYEEPCRKNKDENDYEKDEESDYDYLSRDTCPVDGDNYNNINENENDRKNREENVNSIKDSNKNSNKNSNENGNKNSNKNSNENKNEKGFSSIYKEPSKSKSSKKEKEKEKENDENPISEWMNEMEKEDTINTRKSDENRDFDSESTSIFTDLKKEKLKTKEVILSKATEVIESHVTKKRKKRKNETVKKECNNEVFAVKTKRASFSQSQRRFVRTEKQVHSGDNTVPYVSLSAAHRWLEDDSGGKEEDNKKWTEKRPEIIHKNLFDTWATLKMTSTVTTVDPAVDMFHSIRGNGDTTVIMEMYGVDHLDVAKHPYVHFLMFENLLIKMSQELCLNGTDTSCTKQFEADKSKKSIFRFPKDAATDVQRLGRQMSVAANQAIESLKERYQQ